MIKTDARSQQIGQLVLGKGLATKIQIKECFLLQQQLAEKGWNVPGIDELLVSKGFVPESKLRDLLSGLKATTVRQTKPTQDSRIVGEPFGKFVLMDRLRSNEVRRVFRAQYTPTGAHVMLHIFTRQAMSQESVRKIDFREIVKSTQGFRHPGILRIVTAGSLENRFYYASPYVEGRTLLQYIEAEDNPDISTVVDWAVQIAEALKYGHERNVCHEAIEPENILITAEGMAVLCGYAIAHQVRGTEMLMKQTEAYRPFYLAPEQFGKSECDPRSDIYGFGATLYHVLTGKPPILGRSLEDAVNAVTFQPIDSPSVLRPDLPRLLARTVHSMVNGDLDERPPTVVALLRSLKAVQKQLAKEAKTAAPKKRPDPVGGLGFVLCLEQGCGATFALPLLDAGKSCTCPSCGKQQIAPKQFLAVSCKNGHANYVAANLKGLSMICRTCQDTTVIDDSAATIRPDSAAWIYFPCKQQNCEAMLMLKKEDAGKDIQCPSCKKTMATPMRTIVDPIRDDLSVLRFLEAKPVTE